SPSCPGALSHCRCRPCYSRQALCGCGGDFGLHLPPPGADPRSKSKEIGRGMPATSKPNPQRDTSPTDWIVPAAAVATVFVMLVPVPSFVLDVLLSLSISASVL